jgi:hypothetical protein
LRARRVASSASPQRELDGVILVFDDTLEHEAWNRSDRNRYVLHLDFFRPEVPLDAKAEKLMNDLRLRIFRTYPRVLPHAQGAGIEPDPEAIEWFRTMNLSFYDPEVHTDEEWRLFLEKVRRRISRRGGAVRGWADGSVTPSHRRQPRRRPSGLRGGVKSSWRQGVAPAGSLHPPAPTAAGDLGACASGVVSSRAHRNAGGIFPYPEQEPLTVERSTGPVTVWSAA